MDARDRIHMRLHLGFEARGQTLEVLTQAEAIDAHLGLRRDLARVGYAAYFVELVDGGTEERQPAPSLWALLVAALGLLEGATAPDILARAFELQAMRLLGYEPELARCVADQQPLDEALGSAFQPLRGGMLCPHCARTQAW